MKTTLILALAALMSTAHAQMKDDPGPGTGRGLRVMPGLDEATEAKIDRLRTEHQKNVISLRAKLQAARVDFRSMMRKDNPDEASILSKQKEIAGLRGEIGAAAITHRFAVDKLLTPEQREFLKEHRGRGMHGERGLTGRRFAERRGMGIDSRHRRGPGSRRGIHRDGSCCR